MACSERELFPQRGIAACLSPHFRGQERGVQGGSEASPAHRRVSEANLKHERFGGDSAVRFDGGCECS